MKQDAVISNCERYRYLLRRSWNDRRMRALFIMLNPSTADAEIDDPTIRSCIRLMKALGFGSLEVINLYGWRTTDPSVLTTVQDPVGPDNDRIAKGAINRCDILICAWGAHVAATQRVAPMLNMVRGVRPAVFCFGETRNGSPKHPLYIKSGTCLYSYSRL